MSEPCMEDYTIGWICALQEEFEAACRMLDEEFKGPETSDINDNNTYVFGRIHEHNVVIGCLPDGRYGIGSAAVVSRDMVRSFPSLKFALMVGIGGGVPTSERDIRLGDVVVSVPQGKLGGVIQYDFGKRLSDGQFQLTSQLNSPPEVLLGAIPEMRRRHNDPRKSDRVLEHMKIMEDMPEYQRPAEDRLYRADYEHTGGITCVSCATNGLEERPLRVTKRAVTIHYGIIASANSVMKNAEERDKYARDPELNVLCFEMEAAGLMNNFPCLVIRGICDYSDSHKNDEWHRYAALAAAAYARELLHVLKPRKVTALPSWAGKFKEILSGLDTKVNQLSDGVQDMRFRQLNQEHQAILDWLTPVNYGSQQSDYFGNRQEGTGQWFLESAEYREWLDADGKTLFCPGIPGAGKTILSSIVINDLHTRFSDNPKIGIAYIYCNFRREQEQKIEDLLASLLKQFSGGWHCLPESVNSLHDKHKKNTTRPLLEELSETLQFVVELYAKVFIIVDALDECQALDDCRGRLLSEIFKLQGRFTVNLCATSRPISDITNIFNRALCLVIRATKDDVALYLKRHLATLRSVVRTNPRLQEQIKAGISDAVDGMFLLAHIYLQFLKDKVTENDVRRALEEIHKQKQAFRGNKHKLLSSAYDHAMERINRQETGLRELAIQVLSWITCAKRQLTTIEFQHALATKKGKRTLDTGDLVPVEDIVSVCAGLVTVDKESDIIRLAHYTTQHYFNDKRNELFPFVESNIIITCVTYLSFDVFKSGFCRTDEEFEERMRLNPFYDYSARHWGDHARETPTLCQEAIDFLGSAKKVESSSQALMAKKNLWSWQDSQVVPRQMTGLHLAAYLGIKDGVKILSIRNPVNHRDSYGRIALSYAAMRGNEAIVKLLLDTGKVDADARDNKGRTPLWWAAEGGHKATIKLLLSTGKVDVDARDENGWTPLSMAAGRGHEATIKLLLDTGKVNVDAKDGNGRTLLSQAAMAGRASLVKLLLSTGKVDVDARDENGWTPLSMAAGRGHEATIKLLLDTGKVDVDARDENGWTPLSMAAMAGRELRVKRLLDKEKVDVNARDTKYGRTPHLMASGGGHEAIVKLLLNTGKVEVDARDNKGRTPLWWAVGGGHEAIVKLLLDTGKVKVDVPDVDGWTPFLWAAERGHKAIVKLLLSTGKVDVDARDENGWTPLAMAAMAGRVFLVKLLLDTGKVDVNARDTKYGRTPLSWAAGRGHESIVKLLVEHRANVELKDKDERTALSRAITEGRVAITQLLAVQRSLVAEPSNTTSTPIIRKRPNSDQYPLSSITPSKRPRPTAG
ncbi:PNP_UDP_1 domain-containing protein [Fusarium acuminatum]|uniref:PNP_UDP_1 domain-containing protein n=1 Tax=Fusarium acuminatum TaxID=5515 RepID=A0ABZ2XEI7_9HYPO